MNSGRLIVTPAFRPNGVFLKQLASRRGFTLLEMLLVVGLIAAFVSMTVPSVMRIFGQQKLTESAEKVRTAIATTRVRAIESGVIYQFCCEPNGGHFAIVPFESDHVNSGNVSGGGNSGPVTLNMRFAGQLPKGIIFKSVVMGVSGNVVTPTNSHKIASTSFAGLSNSGDLAGINWSVPILFTSDGSANMDAEIIVSDRRSQQIKLRVRAFTGAVSLGRIHSEKR